jgi:hypothetical protein
MGFDRIDFVRIAAALAVVLFGTIGVYLSIDRTETNNGLSMITAATADRVGATASVTH